MHVHGARSLISAVLQASLMPYLIVFSVLSELFALSASPHHHITTDETSRQIVLNCLHFLHCRIDITSRSSCDKANQMKLIFDM